MSWKEVRKILVIKPDNMGDLIMSGPAIRALKETFNAHITVLTSSMASGIAKLMPAIDDVLVVDLPWVKTADRPNPSVFQQVVSMISEGEFDAAVIFTVFSQNPLPTAMLAYLAGIPRILAYCRENPYHLITDWVPDQEPYELIKHQVRRDLDLVAAIGATPQSEHLQLMKDPALNTIVEGKMTSNGIDVGKPWMLLHAGVSEQKRQYPTEHWIQVGKQVIAQGYQVILTGSGSETLLAAELADQIGAGAISMAGMFPIAEFVELIRIAPALLSVNTGTIHIAAACQTPVVVLYAQTNPQHTPWNCPSVVLEYSVPQHLRSNNEVIAHLNRTLYDQYKAAPDAHEVISAVIQVTSGITANNYQE
ncbi:glycosyltransferase family 9 protein [Mucilaginibacter daejeonensis]|uniref:glycosyltransferase family 9 protein n=1 Tax=Mucilaginibacter daejeonensis TaxID=398049 RepID=UPI001D176B9D|nr:glycosyltransferase family 9 protein [Mucilaginibacter daejeonensis]UEG54778.1 glycosyltransferase family 9 protein [Mucilaginibacter daejeonensis]